MCIFSSPAVFYFQVQILMAYQQGKMKAKKEVSCSGEIKKNVREDQRTWQMDYCYKGWFGSGLSNCVWMWFSFLMKINIIFTCLGT